MDKTRKTDGATRSCIGILWSYKMPNKKYAQCWELCYELRDYSTGECIEQYPTKLEQTEMRVKLILNMNFTEILKLLFISYKFLSTTFFM